jgi:hypothetical protein
MLITNNMETQGRKVDMPGRQEISRYIYHVFALFISQRFENAFLSFFLSFFPCLLRATFPFLLLHEAAAMDGSVKTDDNLHFS